MATNYLSNPTDSQFTPPSQDVATPQNTPAPPSTPSPAPQPGLWGRVLQGALSGLASGGVAGAVVGAGESADPTQFAKMKAQQARQTAIANAKVQEAQAQPKFQDAQTAAMITDSAMKQRTIDQMPAELKLAQQKGAMEVANYMTSLYGPPGQITQYDPNDHTDAAAHASLAQAAATNGGVVPPTTTLHVGDNLLHWNLNDIASSPSSLANINDAAHVLGRPPISQADYQKLKPEDRIKMLTGFMSLIEPDSTVAPGSINSALVGAKQALAAAPKDANPSMVSMLKQRVDFLQQSHDLNQKDAVQIAGQKAGASQAATEPTKQADTGRTELSKIWTDPGKGFSAALAQGQQTIQSIKAGADGNGLLTSMAPTMEVLGLNHAAGINRISPQEAQAAGLPGSYAERFNGWATKAATGKLTPQLASEGKQLMNIVVDAAHQKAVQSSQFIAANRGLSPDTAVALDRRGNPVPLSKVSGTPQYGMKAGKRVVSYDGGKTIQSAE